MLTTTASLVLPRILKELVAAGAVSDARVEPYDKGLAVFVRVGANERLLGAARGGMRHFQSLDGVASVLQSYGITQFSVETANWVPKTMMVRDKAASASESEADE